MDTAYSCFLYTILTLFTLNTVFFTYKELSKFLLCFPVQNIVTIITDRDSLMVWKIAAGTKAQHMEHKSFGPNDIIIYNIYENLKRKKEQYFYYSK